MWKLLIRPVSRIYRRGHIYYWGAVGSESRKVKSLGRLSPISSGAPNPILSPCDRFGIARIKKTAAKNARFILGPPRREGPSCILKHWQEPSCHQGNTDTLQRFSMEESSRADIAELLRIFLSLSVSPTLGQVRRFVFNATMGPLGFIALFPASTRSFCGSVLIQVMNFVCHVVPLFYVGRHGYWKGCTVCTRKTRGLASGQTSLCADRIISNRMFS